MATAPMDAWTEEKCVQLIREFRARPVLWDKRDPFFFKKTVKPAAWNEISEAMNTSSGACRHKMVVLMSSFRREKAKILNSLKDADESVPPYRSTWFAFKEMAFLMDKDTERKRQAMHAQDDEEVRPSTKETLLKHHMNSPISKEVKRSRTSLSMKSELRTTTGDAIRDDAGITQASGSSQTQSERDEEIIAFTSFLAYKMKNYTDSTKNAVEQAICNIIFKADQHYYESAEIGKYTIIDADTDPLQKSDCHSFNGTTIKMQSYSDSDE